MFQYPIDEALDRKRKHSSNKVNNTLEFLKCMPEFQKDLVEKYTSRMKKSKTGMSCFDVFPENCISKYSLDIAIASLLKYGHFHL